MAAVSPPEDFSSFPPAATGEAKAFFSRLSPPPFLESDDDDDEDGEAETGPLVGSFEEEDERLEGGMFRQSGLLLAILELEVLSAGRLEHRSKS